jgi:NAD(P)H dehydrogenase (quinone)
MKIGVGGASGHLGKATLEELAARGQGHDVIAISRNPEGQSSRFGDYNDKASLIKAYDGLDAVMLIPAPAAPGSLFKTAIDAAVEAGVGHILLLTTTGTREVAEPNMFAAYWQAEQHLIKTASKWTILRMNYYAESFAQALQMSLATVVLAGIGDGRVAFVSRDDVAAAAAGILLGHGKVGSIYSATGPKALSGAERAQAVSEATGKTIAYKALSEAQFRDNLAAMQIPAVYMQPMIDIEMKFQEGGFDIVTGDVERLGGRAPHSLQEVIRANLPVAS